jgi:hypothetical protein
MAVRQGHRLLAHQPRAPRRHRQGGVEGARRRAALAAARPRRAQAHRAAPHTRPRGPLGGAARPHGRQRAHGRVAGADDGFVGAGLPNFLPPTTHQTHPPSSSSPSQHQQQPPPPSSLPWATPPRLRLPMISAIHRSTSRHCSPFSSPIRIRSRRSSPGCLWKMSASAGVRLYRPQTPDGKDVGGGSGCPAKPHERGGGRSSRWERMA